MLRYLHPSYLYGCAMLPYWLTRYALQRKAHPMHTKASLTERLRDIRDELVNLPLSRVDTTLRSLVSIAHEAINLIPEGTTVHLTDGLSMHVPKSPAFSVGDKVAYKGKVGEVVEVCGVQYRIKLNTGGYSHVWAWSGELSPVESISVPPSADRTKGFEAVYDMAVSQDKLSKADRSSIAAAYKPLLDLIDKLAPKSVEAPKLVSGWEALDDMRRRPEARYRRPGTGGVVAYKVHDNRLYCDVRGSWVVSDRRVESLARVEWEKIS